MSSSDEALETTEIQVLARKYRLNLDFRSAAGTIGLKEGRETGASVEIQDFRDYVPGDDPRRIDWMAYGRTRQLVVRLFREEVSPFFDLMIDTSGSMSIEDGRKGALCSELCRWFFYSARGSGVAPRLYSSGESFRRVEEPGDLIFGQSSCALMHEPARAAAALRRSSVRLILTDFMAPVEPASVLRPLSAGGASLILVHLLGPWEAAPDPEGPAMLHAVERDRTADIHLDSSAVARYRKRLSALLGELRDEVFRCGGRYIGVTADKTLEQVLREDFLPAELVEVY